jgi:hypothetical protein
MKRRKEAPTMDLHALYRRAMRQRARRHDLGAAVLVLVVSTAVFTLLPMPAQAHPVQCDKAAGIEKLRCERHEKMAATCGPLKGEAHHDCDRKHLLANPLVCTGLAAAEGTRCEAEKAAFKTCEPKAGRAFIVCVRDTIKESPMGPH